MRRSWATKTEVRGELDAARAPNEERNNASETMAFVSLSSVGAVSVLNPQQLVAVTGNLPNRCPNLAA
jgi:hypothetical protein